MLSFHKKAGLLAVVLSLGLVGLGTSESAQAKGLRKGACGEFAGTLCPNLKKKKLFECLETHKDELSAECQATLSKKSDWKAACAADRK